MLDRDRGKSQSQDRLAIFDRLPRLSPQEERSMIRVCYRGALVTLDNGPREMLSSVSDPNIELTGMPHTDKTTLVSLVNNELTSNGIPHHSISEQRPSFNWENNPPAFNQSLFHMSVTQILNKEFSRKEGLLIIERGIYNPLAFMQLFAELGMCGSDDYEAMKAYIGTQFVGLEDGVIIMQASAIRVNERLEQNGRGLTRDQLRVLETAFRQLPQTIAAMQEKYNPNTPFLIAEIDANQPVESYQPILYPLIGSMYHILIPKNLPSVRL